MESRLSAPRTKATVTPTAKPCARVSTCSVPAAACSSSRRAPVHWGPRHLPFKSGAAQLLLEYLDAPAPPLSVVPVGIHYEWPWAFRSRVEVVVGEPIPMELPAALTPLGRL